MYKRHRFSAEIVQYGIWLYYKFNLSHRDVEDLSAERGFSVSYEANVKIQAKQHYWWPAVDQDGW